MQYTIEKLSENISVYVTKEHRFGTDAFLLADFSHPKHKDKVCDLGTGCGIVALEIQNKFNPKQIFGVDIQPLAIEQFKMSISASCLTEKVTPVLADIKALPKEMCDQSFDLVVCNPPYKISGSGILSQTTADKIARHETLCNIDDICKTASTLLKFGGRLCFCQRPQRLADTIAAMKNANIEPKRLRFVAKNKDGAPWLFLIEGKKGSKPFMQVEPSIFMYEGINFWEQREEK